MVRHQIQLVLLRPTMNRISDQAVDPRIELPAPMGDILILNVSDHRGTGMRPTMMACLEPLDAAS